MPQVDKVFFFTQAFWLVILATLFFILFLRYLILPLNFLEKTRTNLVGRVLIFNKNFQNEKKIISNFQSIMLNITFGYILKSFENKRLKKELYSNIFKQISIYPFDLEKTLINNLIKINYQKNILFLN